LRFVFFRSQSASWPPSTSCRALTRWLARPALAIVVLALARLSSAAQQCPTEPSAGQGFVVERGERQKSDVFRLDQGIVRTVMRYDGTTLLEMTQFEGLFLLDRLDRGRRTRYEPSTDLKALFPMEPGQQASAKFTTESQGQHGRLSVELSVKKAEEMYIGPCKYSVLRIERSESTSAEPARFIDTDLYSPELKLILGREYKDRNGRTELIKYDRIYPIKN
jgi:hypothetical protein